MDANTDTPTPLPQHAPSACLQRHAENLRMLILDLKSKINVKLNKLPFKRNLLQAFIIHMPLQEDRLHPRISPTPDYFNCVYGGV